MLLGSTTPKNWDFFFFFFFGKGIDVRESETDFEQLNWAICTNFYPIMFSRSHSAVQPFFHSNSIIQSFVNSEPQCRECLTLLSMTFCSGYAITS